jgi:drug/metabolite transporter (DMT)-like permease
MARLNFFAKSDRPVDRPLAGIAFKVSNIFLVTVLLSLIKTVEGMPTTELVFFRSLFAVVPVIIWLSFQSKLRATLHTNKPMAHFTRAVLSLFTMFMTFTAVRSLPLPEAITLQYTQPLFVVALSAILLSEAVGTFRWGAVAVGFVGAIIIMLPKLTLLTSDAAISHTELIGTGAALCAAASLAFTLIWLRQLVKTEGSMTITLWLGIYASLLLLLTAPFGWVVPSVDQMGLLVLIGLVGVAVQVLLNESLRAAPASLTAPFEYSSLIFATVIGYFVFDELPKSSTLIGGGILVVAGLTILWRERQTALRARMTQNAQVSHH